MFSCSCRPRPARNQATRTSTRPPKSYTTEETEVPHLLYERVVSSPGTILMFGCGSWFTPVSPICGSLDWVRRSGGRGLGTCGTNRLNRGVMSLFTRIKSRQGQALIMVTVGLLAMFGLLGLTVDLGWMHFVKKSAQAAADAAALAAAQAGLQAVGQAGPFTCGPPLICQPTTPCPDPIPGPPSNTNIEKGCLYAERNGFSVGGNSQRQNVTMTANVNPPTPPTAPGVVVNYDDPQDSRVD
jgi:hypothetical protein